MKNEQNYEFKSEFVKKIAEEKDKSIGGIKDSTKYNLSSVIEYIANGAPIEEVEKICKDIDSIGINFGLDANAVNLIVNNSENENVKYLLQNIRKTMNIDVDGLKDLSSEKFAKLQEMGCKVGKVYVNSGYDKAAAKGYDSNVYEHIITKAEKMVDSAMKKLPKDATEEQRFMAIYNVVIKNTVYDYGAVSSDSPRAYTSRNLEGFFVDGKSVCAGTADVLKQLCEMNGIEAEYVQGNAQSKRENKSCYHAWVKVKIDGKWYNADPTWDANKVGKPYEYCMKSDKDFEGHKDNVKEHDLDKSYQPSYRRDGEGRSISREYHSSYESRSSSSLENAYYDDELRNRKGGRALTQDEINSLNGMPNSSGIAVQNQSILTIIINAILNFGRWTRDKVSGFFNGNSVKKEDLSNLSGKSEDEIKEYAKGLHVDIENTYKKQEELSKENKDIEKSKEDR